MTKIDQYFAKKFQTLRTGTPQWEQHHRNFLVYGLARTVGLRVEEISSLQVGRFLDLNLSGARPTETRNLPIVGKYGRTASPSFSVEILRQLQAYAHKLRAQALARSQQANHDALFVVHVGRKTGAPISREGLQRAINSVFCAAGLFEFVAQANENNSQEQGVLRRKASHSIHDLRHSCACETFYSFVAVFGDSADSRLQALEKVRKQLRHANMETTQNVYAALTERYSTWLSFSEGIDKDRLTLSAPHQSWGYSDG
ncbi:MAG: hypothetical protein AAF870_02655 [Pseudomonadota bacterium]